MFWTGVRIKTPSFCGRKISVSGSKVIHLKASLPNLAINYALAVVNTLTAINLMSS